jgi:hypothetical protein
MQDNVLILHLNLHRIRGNKVAKNHSIKYLNNEIDEESGFKV